MVLQVERDPRIWLTLRTPWEGQEDTKSDCYWCQYYCDAMPAVEDEQQGTYENAPSASMSRPRREQNRPLNVRYQRDRHSYRYIHHSDRQCNKYTDQGHHGKFMAVRCFSRRRLQYTRLLVFILVLWLFGFLFIGYLEGSRYFPHKVTAREFTVLGDTSRGNSCNCSLNTAIQAPCVHHDQISNSSGLSGEHRDLLNVTAPKDAIHECTFPDIDPFDPAVMAATDFFPPVSCEGRVPNLVYVNGETINVNHSKTSSVGDQNNRFKACRYRSIARKPGTDFETIVLFNSSSFNDSITLRDKDDNLVVECYGNNNTVLSRSYFSLIRVKKDLEIKLHERLKTHIAKNSPKEIFNVLMLGIEGNSKQNFQRHMPKARNYLLKVLNALELHKYNKVGDHTYPNIIPILTGQTENELHLNNKPWTLRDYFDDANDDFLWSDFSRAGYRTGLLLDSTNVTAFHFKKKGWDRSPVDYYYRATMLELDRDILMRPNDPNCVGDIPEVTYNFNFWLQMASTFKNSQTQPFFGYSFYNHLSHDNPSVISAGDHLYLQLFEQLKQTNIINNTVIIVFSDHGQRLGKVRRTYNGMIESMTPHVFLVFPPWFQQKYPDVMRVLKINQERLTTNKDLHSTLLDILNFQGKPGIGDITQHAISLFNEIPRERTCDYAGIPFEFCVCNKVSQENVSSVMKFSLATAMVDRIYSYYYKHHNICAWLSLKSVETVRKIDLDNDKKVDGRSLYQMTITTSPGDAVYEARLSVENSTKIVRVIGDVIRLNLYRGQDGCMDDPKLKPFCYCWAQ